MRTSPDWNIKAPQIIKAVAGLACTVALLLSVFVSRDNTLRIRYHVAAMRRAVHMGDVLAGVVPQTRRDRIARVFAVLCWKDTNSGWADSHTRHRDALVRLGYLSQRQFGFPSGQFPTGKYYTNFLPLMRDGTSSFTIMSNGVIEVVAQPAQMVSWAALISKLESRQTP
jgi:hypothetical protein